MKKEKYTCPPNYKTFGLAVQAVVILAMQSSRCPSSEIADQVGTEVTMLRRIMSKLSQAQLIEVREGRDGGYQLKVPPESLTCADIYQALHLEESGCGAMLESAGKCQFGERIKPVLSTIVSSIDHSILAELRRYTIADVIQRIES
ncbi:Rrf2 family transcriptional regulator [Marinicrinis lubricantis]|uniref:Rrf2 family transcriptional regulator n=1 Tax=Marinicrinis lubricantis TaxID=2086470 RepID=A0ABW1ILV9_9BACL